MVVRRSYGIPDPVADDVARSRLITCFEEQLRANGWPSAHRVVAEPMLDALLELGANGDLDDQLRTSGPPGELPPSTSGEAARRIVVRGMSVVDPERLAYDVNAEYPPEVLAAANQAVDRVVVYMREQPGGAG